MERREQDSLEGARREAGPFGVLGVAGLEMTLSHLSVR